MFACGSAAWPLNPIGIAAIQKDANITADAALLVMFPLNMIIDFRLSPGCVTPIEFGPFRELS